MVLGDCRANHDPLRTEQFKNREKYIFLLDSVECLDDHTHDILEGLSILIGFADDL